MPRMSPCSTERFQCDVLHCSRLLLVLMEFAELPLWKWIQLHKEILRGACWCKFCSGAKAPSCISAFAARLKSCPDTSCFSKGFLAQTLNLRKL